MDPVQTPTPAESSPVETPIPDFSEMTDTQYESYMRTGKLPEKKAASAPAKDQEQDTSGDAPEKQAASESASASEAVQSQEKPKEEKRSNAASRVHELLEERKRDRQRIAELEKQLSTPKPEVKTEKPAESSSAAEAEKFKPLSEEEFFKKNPQATYDDYVEAKVEHRAKWETEQRFKTWQSEQEKKAKDEAIAKEQKSLAENFRKRVDEAAKDFADYPEVAFAKDLEIPEGSFLDGYIANASDGARLLYYLGKNREKLAEINAMQNPYHALDAIRELMAANTKTVTPPAKKVTGAPPPPRELNTRSVAAGDEVEQALKDDDTDAYFAAMNRRDIARRKGK